ncbi:MAG TPA: tetratricopeptide repeat protein [Thermoanaerobaculia bacterium]|nr:tetratricopeptide repeat protein [Thermoanaerobaculia bacterium]
MRVPTLLAAALLSALPLAAQPEEGPPPGGPPGGPGQQRGFVYAQMMRAMNEKSDLLLEAGKPDAAIETLSRVLTIDVPKEHPAFEIKAHLIGKLAVVYASQGKKKEAVETIQRLLAEVPQGGVAEAAAWVDAGAVYKQAGMPDEALKAFDKAIALSEKLAKAPPRGPAGRPMPPPGGRPPGSRPPKGDYE